MVKYCVNCDLRNSGKFVCLQSRQATHMNLCPILSSCKDPLGHMNGSPGDLSCAT